MLSKPIKDFLDEENKRVILMTDFKWMQWASLFAIILMFCTMLYNLYKQNIGWAILDASIGIINIWALVEGLNINRNNRLLEEDKKIIGEMKKTQARKPNSIEKEISKLLK